jgi:sugar phosphate isomerase/epimerase
VQKAYIEAARSHGLEIGSLAMGELNSVPLATEPKAAIWLLDTVEAAKAMGVKVILMAFFGRGEVPASDKVGMDRLVGVLKEVAPRAEKAGVILGLENYLSAEENLKVIERVGSPALQVYYDVGNSTDKGYDILKEIRLLGSKLICEFHAKDGRHYLGKGRIDFKKVREAMDEIGFSGWIQIEAAARNGVVPDYKAHLAYLKGIFPAEC